MRFDQNFSAVHGYLCADGYVIRNPPSQKHKYYSIGLRNQNKILLKDFQRRFQEIFKKKPKIRRDGRCAINSKEVYFNIIKYGPYYSKIWVLPHLSKEDLRFWLRAFFDCEAWVICKKGQDRHIGLESINQKGLMQVKRALLEFGIKNKMVKRKDREIYRLSIFGKENLIKFHDEIGFLHPEKRIKLKDAINSYINYEWDYPKERNKLVPFIVALMKEKAKIKKPFLIRVISNTRSNLFLLTRFLKLFFNIESKIYKEKNGIGTVYYSLMIQKKDSVKKVLDNGLLNNEQRNKIRKLFK